ncbi:MAG: hypothetical protein ACPG4T_17690 [Nannocystaceae bacterium]
MSGHHGTRPLLLALGGVGLWVALLLAITGSDVIDNILPFWPLWFGLSIVASVTADSWTPTHASIPSKLLAFIAFVAIQALGTAPIALSVYAAGEAGYIFAWAWMSGLCASGIIGYAVIKQTFEIEPIDALAALLITVSSVFVITVCYGLDPGFVVASPIFALPNLMLMHSVGNVMLSDGQGRSTAGSLHLISAAVFVANELGFFMAQWGPRIVEWLEQVFG